MLCCSSIFCSAQYLTYAKPILDTLCSAKFSGRGYVNDGVNLAASYIANKLNSLGLDPIGSSYYQKYSFPINTFPGPISCTLDGVAFEAGQHFLVSPSAKGIDGNFRILPFQINNETDRALLFMKLQAGLSEDEAILFRDVQDARALSKFQDSLSKLGYRIPLTLIGSTKKLLWTPSSEQSEDVELTFPDSFISNKDYIRISFQSKFISDFACKNIIACLPGTKKKAKECLVFSAHYDHLGMLGNKAYFPGASDNASGVSMLLSLANYFKDHRPEMPVYFIFFSGEEVGLLGSKYFVSHPTIALNKIHTLINIDIMGSAEGGITVVNGETNKKIFDKLVAINAKEKFLPEVKIRGKAANSDHYFFSEAGVPSIFIYSNGGPGWYHDVWDTPSTLTTTNFDNVAKLLIQYVEDL
jgi:aminopeptidase YwaD